MTTTIRRIFLVMNPASRGGKSARTFSTIKQFFDRAGISYTCSITKSLDDATAMTQKACDESYDTVVAVGGDGTINRVINGFFSPEGTLRSSTTRMGVIHTGTSPDFCKSYGIPTELDAACTTVCDGSVRRIPLGTINFTKNIGKHDHVTDTNETATSFFGCCANIGLGASLANAANSGIRKILGDSIGTFCALLRVLAGYRPSTIEIVLDGNRTMQNRVYNMSIGRTYYIASGIKIANTLTDADNRFYTLTVRNISLRTLPLCLYALYSGKPFPQKEIFRFDYGRHFTLSSPDTVAVEFDGDAAGFLPCTVAIAPDRLPLICGSSHA
jgi:diacylglycerol kinase family enzyme